MVKISFCSFSFPLTKVACFCKLLGFWDLLWTEHLITHESAFSGLSLAAWIYLPFGQILSTLCTSISSSIVPPLHNTTLFLRTSFCPAPISPTSSSTSFSSYSFTVTHSCCSLSNLTGWHMAFGMVQAWKAANDPNKAAVLGSGHRHRSCQI